MSWAQLAALKQQHGSTVAEMRKLVDDADKAKAELSAEQMTKFTDLEKRAGEIKGQIDVFERMTALDAALKAQPGNGNRPGREDVNDGGEKRTINGFDATELRGYSLLKAIARLAKNQPLDGLEKEVSDELAKRSGKQPQGFFYPTELPLETRALDLTTGAGAKATFTDAGNFIELLRDRTVVTQLGARMLTGLQGDLSLPRQNGGATAAWVAEGAAPAGSNATVGQIGLAPKTISAFCDLTRKFILQSSLSAEQFVRNDLARVIAIAIDRAALNGSGAGAEPQGILQNGGVGTVAIGTNGGAPTFAHFVSLETNVAAANADVGSMGYCSNPKVRGVLKTTLEAATAGAQMVWRGDNTINGYKAMATTLVPSNLTKGTGTNLSAAIFGNWDDLVLAFWSQLDINVDPYTLSSSGGVRIVCLQDTDVKIRHNESFQKIVDAIA